MLSNHPHDVERCNRSYIFLTPKTWHYIACGLQYGSIFAGHPFKWNRKENRTEAANVRQLRLWTLNMVVAFIFAGFVGVRCLQTNMDVEKTSAQKIYMRVMAAYLFLSVVLHSSVILNREVIPAYNNQCYELALLMERNYLNTNAQKPLLPKLTGWALQLCYISCKCLAVLMTLNAFLRPMSPEQPTSLLGTQPTVATRISSAAFMGYIHYLYASSTCAITMSSFPPFSLFLTLLSEMSSRTCQITKESFRRSTKVKFALYQRLRIEILLYNKIFMDVAITGFKTVGVTLVVYGIFGGIRMQGIEASALGVLGTLVGIVLLVTFSFLAEFHFRSNGLLREWMSQLHWDVCRKWARKYVKALPSLKICIRSCYFVDRHIVLTLASVLAVNTSSVLLLHR